MLNILKMSLIVWSVFLVFSSRAGAAIEFHSVCVNGKLWWSTHRPSGPFYFNGEKLIFRGGRYYPLSPTTKMQSSTFCKGDAKFYDWRQKVWRKSPHQVPSPAKISTPLVNWCRVTLGADGKTHRNWNVTMGNHSVAGGGTIAATRAGTTGVRFTRSGGAKFSRKHKCYNWK